MAVFLNNKVGVKVNSVDLSDHVTSVTLNRSFNELSVTAMGDTGEKFVKGLETSSVAISFLNDTASANVLATLQAAWGTSVTVVLLQEKGTAVSATNPTAATGGRGGDTLEEIRQNTLALVSSQKRSVTADDYLIRALSMPSEYGAVSKAYIEQPKLTDNQVSTIETLSLYVLSLNSSKIAITSFDR